MDSKNIKWGFIGTGWIAQKFANALKETERAELYAIGSRSIESARMFAERFNAPKVYGSYEEVARDPEVDVIYIATPHNLHCVNTLLCLENNKHVLCEKPFGVNGKEVRKMIAAAKERDLFLMEALWTRFLPNIIKTKEIVDSGELGKVKLLTAYFDSVSPGGPDHRHFNIDLCGGSLLDLGIYNVFLALLLLGQPEQFKALADTGSNGVDNSIGILFKYPGDSLAVLHSSFVAETPKLAEIHCEKGKIVLEHLWFCPGDIKIVYNDGREEAVKFKFRGNGYNYEAQEVVDCIAAGKRESSLMSHEFSLKLIDMLDAIRKECGIVYPKHDL
jgi:scyllo-inositol 2-dehydrogenase (NADP+)